MEQPVDIVIEDARWEGFGLAARADAAARAAFAELGLAPEGVTFCLMGCDDTRIAALNADFRGRPQPTNVLSWPSGERAPDTPGAMPQMPGPGTPEEPEELGDIAIAWDTCAREAAEAGRPMEHHVTHLTVHGLLHLLGFDHIDDMDAAVMEKLEQRILARLGVPDPYC